MNAQMQRRLGILAAFATIYIVWGSTYLAIRVALESLPPVLMTALRCSLAGGLLTLVSWLRGEPRPAVEQWRRAAEVAAMMIVGGFAMVSVAEQWVPSGVAAVMVAMIPLYTMLTDALLFGGAWPSPARWAGLGLGLLGVAILVGDAHAQLGVTRPLGLVLLCVSPLLWSCASLYSRRIPLTGSVAQWTGMQMLIGAGMCLVLGLLLGEGARVRLDQVTARSLGAFLYLTVFGSLLGLIAYQWLLREVAPERVATYALVNPVIAVLLGWWLLDEPVSARLLVGEVLILLALGLLLAPDVPRAPGPHAAWLTKQGRPRRMVARVALWLDVRFRDRAGLIGRQRRL